MICEGLLFDLDGVLVDSTPCVTRAWQGWAVERGLDAEKVVHTAHGRRAIETVALMAPHLDTQKEFEDVERRELADTDGLIVIEGADELLRSLPEHRWTVVTSGTRKLSTLRLQTAGLPLPDTFVTADDVAEGKPSPAPYLRGAEVLGLRPDQCVVIEDSPSGIAAANAAGIPVIAVPTTYPREELRHATVLIDTLAQLKARRLSDGRIELLW